MEDQIVTVHVNSEAYKGKPVTYLMHAVVKKDIGDINSTAICGRVRAHNLVELDSADDPLKTIPTCKYCLRRDTRFIRSKV